MKTALMVLLATLGLFATPANAVDDPGWRPVELPQASQRDIQSERTGKVYRIFVSEPRHEPPPGGYPVLYVLDGNAMFPSLAIQAQALENRPGPTLRNSMLVVGIGYPGNELYDFEARSDDYTPKAEDRQRLPNRESAPSGGADDFLAFIEDELKPMIALRYSVNSQRQTLFGHSYGGLFTLYTLLTRPRAFQGYVAASPSIWWYKDSIDRTLDAFERQTNNQPIDARLLVTAGSAEQPAADASLSDARQRRMAERRMVGNARDLISQLKGLTKAGLRSEFQLFPGANHGANATHSSVAALALAAAIGRNPSRDQDD